MFDVVAFNYSDLVIYLVIGHVSESPPDRSLSHDSLTIPNHMPCVILNY